MNTLAHPAPAWLPLAANAIGFNIVWIVTVFGAAGGMPWAGPAAFALFAAWQLSAAVRPRYDLAAMAVFAAAGLLLDSTWSLAGMLSYAAGWPSPHFAPVWLVTLWAAFALTLGHSLAWLRPHPRLTALFGFLGGGFSYGVGARVGAVELAIPLWTYAIGIGLVWAAMLPALVRLTARAARRRLPAHQR